MKHELFRFSDYRAFMKAHFEETQKRNPSWSYRAWSRKLGFNSNSTLLKVISGEREAGPKIRESLAKYFGFSKKEKHYFDQLVLLSKHSTEPEIKLLILRELQRINRSPNFRLLNEDEFNAISHWYYYPIRQLVNDEDFSENPAWIRKRLRFDVKPKQVTEAIETLQRLKLLERNPETGKLQRTEHGFDTTNDVANEALRRFHAQMLDHSKSAIRAVPVEEREISGRTFYLSPKKMAEAKELIRDFHKSFENLAERAPKDRDDPHPNEVFQLQTQFFPLTQPIKGGPA